MTLSKSIWAIVYITIAGITMTSVISYLYKQNTPYQLLINEIERKYSVTDFEIDAEDKETRQIKIIRFTVGQPQTNNLLGRVNAICTRLDKELSEYQVIKVYVTIKETGLVERFQFAASNRVAQKVFDQNKSRVIPPDPRMVMIRESLKSNGVPAREIHFSAEPKTNPKTIRLEYKTTAFAEVREYDVGEACRVVSELLPAATVLELAVTEIGANRIYRYTYTIPDGPLAAHGADAVPAPAEDEG